MPSYTIGFGCSGGSYQQHQAADNYPGLLDGIIPGCSFPEVNFATVHSITDARLIGNYFLNTATIPWTDEQKRQVVGFYGLVTMTTSTVYDGALRISPTGFCPSVLPPSERYNAATNPTGARCDVYDRAVNVFPVGGAWLKLVIGGDLPRDAERNPLEVKVWRDRSLILRAARRDRSPLTRYVRMPDGASWFRSDETATFRLRRALSSSSSGQQSSASFFRG